MTLRLLAVTFAIVVYAAGASPVLALAGQVMA